ncbi:conjugative transposon protein TraM [Bacteroides ovatus]|uniref:conjugative transposon protein TraM n=1 Tax=Bacteroides ovatus TaxID=28116 RepID=UPI00202F372E|nr:conjugative transposon protein TraM [Bacteroides ovatus]MCM1722577.1 conjugative transposon protein TraM [Bacteroides ovatus]MCM1757683.1 conjugative transposon protein TraM [Bacteroides ovatus]MCM1868692.1 conjugative transposon protein TraM [Bacteroides ovatus]MCM1910931.1 conjugative transposon protein TraM [Bacteroides ovatus]
MKEFKLKEILKDKNKVLIIMVVVLFILFLVVILKTKNGSSEVAVPEEPNKALLEPVSKDEKVLADKLEAYKKDQLAAKKEKMLEAAGVKGSDFYFDMQGSDNKYSERMKQQIERMQTDPYDQVMDGNGYSSGNDNGDFTNKMRSQLNSIEEQQEFDELLRQAKKNVRLKKGMSEEYKVLQSAYDKYLGVPQNDTVSPKVQDDDMLEDIIPEPRFIINEEGRRQRRPQYEIPGKKNLVKAAIYGDQTIVSGTPVKMRLLEPLLISGIEIPANTIFFGSALVGASRMKITVENFRYGTYMSPVSFVIFDNDAIEGLNLPNNMKAESARKMEQGILQGVQLPISSIGTVTSEVTSAITATTQVAKQLLNQSLSQVKVHLKANYQIYLKEETKMDKRKREAEEAELERMFKQIEMQKNEPTKKNPLTSLIESM